VYALGVLLHEVLCGRPPYDIRHKNLAEAARVIREEDPSTLGSFDRSLRGDLDVIAGKCLAKEKERRYGSVAELAADVTRHLCDEPILARPAGTWYQVSKFAHRNKVAVAGGIAVLAALILGMIGTTWQAIRATHANKETDKARAGERAQLAKAIGEQKAAKEQADASQAVVEFIRRMLISVEPDNLGREAKVVDLLSYADQNLDRELGGQPEAWYTLRNTLASSFISLGRQAEAEREINVLLDRAGRDGRTNDRQLWNARNALGVVRNAQGKSKEALEIYRECIEAERSDSSWPTLEMIQTLENYGLALQELGRLAESERALREAKDLAQSKLGDTHRETLTAKVNLATTLGLIGKVQESRAIIAAEIPKLEETIGVDGEMTLVAIEQLAKQESSAGNALAAERGFRRVYDTRMRIYGERHPQTLVAMSNLGDVLRLLKRLPEAQLMTERALALRREILGPEHPQTLSTQHSYSQLLSALGRFQEAAELCEHTLESRIALLGEDHPITLTTMNNLAMTYVDLKRLDDGLRRIDRVIELRTKVLGPEHWQTIKSREVRAEMFQRCGKPAESEAALRELIGPATEALKENHSIVVSIRCYHARCLRDLKRLDECERELLGLRQMLDANGVKGEDGRSITVNRNLVALYTAWDKPEKAEPYRSPGTP
jgi:tetratricopeptide (TPR) repeat protein